MKKKLIFLTCMLTIFNNSYPCEIEQHKKVVFVYEHYLKIHPELKELFDKLGITSENVIDVSRFDTSNRLLYVKYKNNLGSESAVSFVISSNNKYVEAKK